MAVILERTTQVGLKIEGTEGTPESLAAGDFSGNFKDDAHTYAPGEYERGIKKGTLTPLGVVRTGRTLSIRATAELVGGGAAAEAPWHRALRAMGFSAGTQVKKVVLGTVTNGPFRCGQRLGDNATEGSATKTGIAVHQGPGATPTLWYVPGTGAFADTDTVYNYGQPSQASAPVDSAPANAGYRFTPLSETASGGPPAATVERRDGLHKHTMTAARGKGVLSFRMNEVPLLAMEFMGVPVVDLTDPDAPGPVASALMTGIPAVGARPLPCKHQPITIAGHTPVLTQCEVTIENTLTMRGTIADTDRQQSGYVGCRITERRVTANLDPEKDVTGTLAAEAWAMAGTDFELLLKHGDPAHANGMLIVRGPRCQLSGDQSPEARDGIVTEPLTAVLTGDADDEIEIYHLF